MDSRSKWRAPPSSTHAFGSSAAQQPSSQEGGEEPGAVDWAAMLPNRREALAHMRDLLSYVPLSSQLPPPKAGPPRLPRIDVPVWRAGQVVGFDGGPPRLLCSLPRMSGASFGLERGKEAFGRQGG